MELHTSSTEASATGIDSAEATWNETEGARRRATEIIRSAGSTPVNLESGQR